MKKFISKKQLTCEKNINLADIHFLCEPNSKIFRFCTISKSNNLVLFFHNYSLYDFNDLPQNKTFEITYLCDDKNKFNSMQTTQKINNDNNLLALKKCILLQNPNKVFFDLTLAKNIHNFLLKCEDNTISLKELKTLEDIFVKKQKEMQNTYEK